jgi:hypothetical protein
MVKKITISDNESTASESSVENSEQVKKEFIKIEKPKKVLSEKQKEALVRGREKRREKIDEKKLNKKIEASKFLLELDHKKKKATKPKIESEEEDDDEEEVVIIEKKRKPKKKVKRIIVEESESSDDQSTESQEPPKIQEKKMKSQRNKKSVITVHEDKPIEEIKQLKKTDFKQYFI